MSSTADFLKRFENLDIGKFKKPPPEPESLPPRPRNPYLDKTSTSRSGVDSLLTRFDNLGIEAFRKSPSIHNSTKINAVEDGASNNQVSFHSRPSTSKFSTGQIRQELLSKNFQETPSDSSAAVHAEINRSCAETKKFLQEPDSISNGNSDLFNADLQEVLESLDLEPRKVPKTDTGHKKKSGKKYKRNTLRTFKKNAVDFERPDLDYEIFAENESHGESEVSDDDLDEFIDNLSDETCEDSSEDEAIRTRVKIKKKGIDVVREAIVKPLTRRKLPSMNVVRKKQREAIEGFDEAVSEIALKKQILLQELNGLKMKKHPSQNQKAHRQALEAELDVVEKKNQAVKLLKKSFDSRAKSYLEKLEDAIDMDDHDLAWELHLNLRMEWKFLEKSFPIYHIRDEIVEKLKQHQVLVVLADTGSGKSTQLTQFLMQAGYGDKGLIACTEPRKVAATSLAKHISSEIGCTVGGDVGFHVGFHRRFSRRTKVVYTTNYTLLKECVKDPDLKDHSCVIVDEAHERSIGTDLLLGMLKQCIQKRPDLKIIITSATIDPFIFTKYFGGCPVVEAGGRTFPVEIYWEDGDKEADPMSNYLDESVELAHKLHRTKPPGDILVFLTAPNEIEDAVLKLQYKDDKSELVMAQLHGRLQYDEQAKVFDPTPEGKRKVVFATVVGETSITIPGIKYVIDCGLVKENVFDSKRNINKIEVHAVSKSSADQRKGRAGRVSSGECYRLYSQTAYDKMRAGSLPEILRVHLGHALLRLLELGVHDPLKFDFVESPSKESLEAAFKDLVRLGAVDEGANGSHLTVLGSQLAKLPVEPALGKLVILGFDDDIAYEGILLAAVNTNQGSVFYYAGTDEEKAKSDMDRVKFCLPEGDLMTGMRVYKEWLQAGKQRNWCLNNSIHSKSMRTISNTAKEIISILTRELGYQVTEEFSTLPPQDLCRKIQRLLLICFPQNLSVFTGHLKLGYMLLESPDQYAGIHGSSALRYLGNLTPKYLVHGQLMTTWRDYIVDLTPIDEDVVDAATEEGILSYDLTSIVRVEECARFGPYGDKILRKHLNGFVMKKVEAQMREHLGTNFITIDTDLQTGIATFYLPVPFHEEALVMFINDIGKRLLQEKQFMKNKVVYHSLKTEDGKPFTKVALMAGMEALEILNPHEYVEVMVTGMRGYLPDSLIENEFSRFGKVLATYWTRFERFRRMVVIFPDSETARRCVDGLSRNGTDLRYVPVFYSDNKAETNENSRCTVSVIVEGVKESFEAKPDEDGDSSDDEDVNELIITHRGFGFVRCHRASDAPNIVDILRKRAKRELQFLKDPDKKSIAVSPSKKNPTEVYVGNFCTKKREAEIEKTVTELIKREKIRILHFRLIKLKEPLVVRVEPTPKQAPIQEKDGDTKEKVVKLLRSTGISFLDMEFVETGDERWECLLKFYGEFDGETALKTLKGANLPKGITFKGHVVSSMLCGSRIFKTVKTPMEDLVSYLKRSSHSHGDVSLDFQESPHRHERERVEVEITTETVEMNTTTKFLLKEILKGQRLDLSEREAAPCLFTRTGQDFLKTVEKDTKTTIHPEAYTTTLIVYGTEESRCQVTETVNSYLDKMEEEGKIMLYEKDVKQPGLIRKLVSTFGIELHTLIEQTSATKTYVNVRTQKLVVYSTKDQFDEVSRLVDELAATLPNTDAAAAAKDKDQTQQLCPVCLCEVEGVGYRLQYCLHVYCQVCIRIQIQNDITIPLVCCHEDCGESLVLDDITPLVPGDSPLLEKLVAQSVKELMGKNSEKYFACPHPDCKMIFKKDTEGSTRKDDAKRKCPYCSHDVCIRCAVAYHEGQPCEDYILIKDEDLQSWIMADPGNRKKCPGCSTLVEKIHGCNRMQCTRCHTIFCWNCIQPFGSDGEVYRHLPMCTVETTLARMNQE